MQPPSFQLIPPQNPEAQASQYLQLEGLDLRAHGAINEGNALREQLLQLAKHRGAGQACLLA
jgi:hypothetical protein